MTKIIFHITLICVTLFLTQCNNPKQTENVTANIASTKNSSYIKNKVESSIKTSTVSEITCPKCGFKKMETLPTDVCLIKYKCDSCNTVSYSKDGDCCVFCSYGTHKCPSKQEN